MEAGLIEMSGMKFAGIEDGLAVFEYEQPRYLYGVDGRAALKTRCVFDRRSLLTRISNLKVDGHSTSEEEAALHALDAEESTP